MTIGFFLSWAEEVITVDLKRFICLLSLKELLVLMAENRDEICGYHSEVVERMVFDEWA